MQGFEERYYRLFSTMVVPFLLNVEQGILKCVQRLGRHYEERSNLCYEFNSDSNTVHRLLHSSQ
jgi:hypothetical protein